MPALLAITALSALYLATTNDASTLCLGQRSTITLLAPVETIQSVSLHRYFLNLCNYSDKLSNTKFPVKEHR